MLKMIMIITMNITRLMMRKLPLNLSLLVTSVKEEMLILALEL